MSAGSVLHKALELEVKTVVEVEVASREDAWALRLIECIVCLRQLMRKGMTRELYVFGKLQVDDWHHPIQQLLKKPKLAFMHSGEAALVSKWTPIS